MSVVSYWEGWWWNIVCLFVVYHTSSIFVYFRQSWSPTEQQIDFLDVNVPPSTVRISIFYDREYMQGPEMP